MIAFLALIYCIGLYLVFIKFRLLPFNLLAQICVALVGFFGLLIILFGMNFTQPFTIGATVSEFTTPVVARVPGRVVEVPVHNNSLVRKGEVLFRMDPQPYVDSYHAAEAGLSQADIQTQNSILQAQQSVDAAIANVQGIEAAIQATKAAIQASKAHLALATTRLKEYTELASKNAGSQFEVERYSTDVTSLTEQITAQEQQMAAQQQQLAAAKAQQIQAQTSLQTANQMRPAAMAQAKAQLDAAKWNVEQTTVYAPDDGYITQLNLQPGAMASLTPVMVFVSSSARSLVVATMMQNYMNTFQIGADAEVALPALPGKILKGRVTAVEMATGAGQMDPEGRLSSSYMPRPPDRMLIRLHLEDNMSSYVVPVGSSGWISIRGNDWKELYIIRRVIMRWYTWTNYIFAGY